MRDVGARLRLRVRARDVMLAKSAPPDLSALNVLPGVVADIAARDGPIVEIRLDCNGDALVARLTRYSVERLGLAPGAPVYALIKSVALDRRSLSGPLQGSVGARRAMREVATSHSAGKFRIASTWLGIRECALLLALDSGGRRGGAARP